MPSNIEVIDFPSFWGGSQKVGDFPKASCVEPRTSAILRYLSQEDVKFLTDLQESAIPNGQAVRVGKFCGFQPRA